MSLANRPDRVKEVIKSLRKLGTRMVLYQQKAAQALGVVPTDFKTADILNETGPVTAGELAKITGLSTGSVTALIDRLEHEGYVKREKDPSDRRRVIIVPVEHIQKDVKEHYLPLIEEMSTLCSHYSEEELALIIDFIERTCGVHEEILKNDAE